MIDWMLTPVPATKLGICLVAVLWSGLGFAVGFFLGIALERRSRTEEVPKH